MQIFGRFLLFFINAYVLILMMRVILTWLKLPQARWIYWVCKITDPVIDYFRKNYPIKVGVIDISIIIPFMILSVLRKIILDLMVLGVPFSLFYLIGLAIIIIDMAYTFVAFILFIFTIVLLIVNINAPSINNPFISTIRTIIDPIVMYIRRFYKINSIYSDRIYLVILAVLIIVAGFVGHAILMHIYLIIDNLSKNSLQNLGMDDNLDFE
ncbi:MAG: YggT family protein [Spirochaetes bacterium]|nr:YggT family protein [Spirochaetota bacterium]